MTSAAWSKNYIYLTLKTKNHLGCFYREKVERPHLVLQQLLRGGKQQTRDFFVVEFFVIFDGLLPDFVCLLFVNKWNRVQCIGFYYSRVIFTTDYAGLHVF